MAVNRQVILAEKPVGKLTLGSFRLDEVEIPTPGEGEVLVKARYISRPRIASLRALTSRIASTT